MSNVRIQPGLPLAEARDDSPALVAGFTGSTSGYIQSVDPAGYNVPQQNDSISRIPALGIARRRQFGRLGFGVPVRLAQELLDV